MAIECRPLRRQDFKRAMRFAVKGMHFNRYMTGRFWLGLYGRYFWYDALQRASQVVAAYRGDRLVGVLLADMKGEKKAPPCLWQKMYVGLMNALASLFFQDQVAPYDLANRDMLRALAKGPALDGEINFLAADPDAAVRGIGTALLEELERRKKGKRIYVYTDSNCSWQFYEHRGFVRAGQRQIDMHFDDVGTVPLTCYLFSKVCGA